MVLCLISFRRKATIDRREVGCGYKALHARRFGSGRRQKRAECNPKCAHEAQATELDSGRYGVHVASYAERGEYENDEKSCRRDEKYEWYKTSEIRGAKHALEVRRDSQTDDSP